MLLSRLLAPLWHPCLRVWLKRQYRNQKPDRRGPNERPLEYAFALEALALAPYQDALDIGSGRTAWPALVAGCGYHVTAIDKVSGDWKLPFSNRHFYVFHRDITQPLDLPQKFGIITCLSTLEHIPDHRRAVSVMAGMLKPGGVLILSFPYNEERYVENVYRLPGAGYGRNASYICQVYNRQSIQEWLSATSLELVLQRYYRVFSGELWTFGQRLSPMQEVTTEQPHHLTALVLRRPAQRNPEA